MSTSTKVFGSPQRKLRWAALTVVILLLLIATVFLFLPWVVALPGLQHWLSAQASRVLAPGTVHFNRLRVSWRHPTEIDGLALRDAQGSDMIVAPSAQFSWNLWHTLVNPRGSATLTLAKATVDIKRSASGSINLLETLKPILGDDPDRTILVRISNGTLRFQQEGLAEPFLADSAHIELDLNAYPQPIAWRMKLAQSGNEAQPGSLQIEGSMSRRKEGQSSPADLELSIRADRWPWRYRTSEIDAQGMLAGTIDVGQKGGDLALLGNARLLNLQATGQKLSGDRPHVEKIDMIWKVQHRGEVWTVEQLEAISSLGTLRASGSFPPAGDQGGHLEARLDLAALARQIPQTLRLHNELTVEKGAVELRAQVLGDANKHGQTIEASGSLTDLAAQRGKQHLTLHDPASFTFRLHREPTSLSLGQFQVQTPFLTASGRGDLDNGINVKATVDMSAATERVRDWVDLGRLKLTGQGTIDARYQRTANTFDLTANADFNGPSASGLPVLDTFHRDHISTRLAIRGKATAFGSPARLDELSLTGQADSEQLDVHAQRQEATNVITVNSRGVVQLTVNGKKQEVASSLQAQSGENGITLDPIVLQVTPFVGPGGQFLPSDKARWSGKGTYNKARDELSIVADSPSSTTGFKELAIAPSRITLGGLTSRDAAWFEVKLSGELADLDLESMNLQSPNPQGLNYQNRSTQHQDRQRHVYGLQLAGQLQSVIQGQQSKAGWEIGARAEVHKLARLQEKAAPQVLAEDLAGSIQGKLAQRLDRLELTSVALQTPYGQLTGAGLVTDLPGIPQLDIHGTLSPDWRVLTNLLASNVEPRASVHGTASAWSVIGALPHSRDTAVNPLATLDVKLGLAVEQVDIFGMQLGKTTLAVRNTQGKIKIDPIDSTLNGGRLHLEPAVVTDTENQMWLHLGPSSALLDAVVNDEVSHRVLSFAAPVLDQATRVRGRVSLAVSDAFLPLNTSSTAQAKIDGDVLFDAVEFMPGPLADQLLSVFRQEHRPLLVLRDPVSIRIVGRRVYQEGLVIPVGNVAAIGLEGWIDFDQNLNLTASFAMVPPRQNIPVLSDILANTQIRVPITGTFQKPRLNGEAIKENFKELGINVLDNLIGAGMGGLGRIIQGGPGRDRPERDFFPPFVAPHDDQPPTPPRPWTSSPKEAAQPGTQDNANAGATTNSAPTGHRSGQTADSPAGNLDVPTPRLAPLTPEERQLAREERRLRRLEKRAERRMRRGLPPE